MNNKILIGVIISICILVGVSFTSVVGVQNYESITYSDSEDDCGCQDVYKVNLFRVKLLFSKLEIATYVILSKLGIIPVIRKNCVDILNVVNTDIQLRFPIICIFLGVILNSLYSIVENLDKIWEKYPNNHIINYICWSIWIIVFSFALPVAFLYNMLECDPPPMIFQNLSVKVPFKESGGYFL